MSDYLWDKTGARDAEVGRLENLLGQLRHSPRPLALPDEVTAARAHDAAASRGTGMTHARAGARAFPAGRHFRASRLAVAAMLLLAFVALALALLRTGATGGKGQPASQASLENSRRGQQQAASDQPQNIPRQAVVPPTQDVAPPSQENVTVASGPEKRGVQDIADAVAKESRKERQLAPKGRQPAFVAKREQPQPPGVAALDGGGGVTSAAQPSSPDDLPLAKRLAAKEQLVYALRLTSSKLSEVRAKTQGDARQGFVEGNRIR